VKNWWTNLVGLGALLAVIGCESDLIAIHELQDELLEASCERAVRCGSVESMEVCESNFSGGTIGPSVLAAINNGTVDYDGVAADQCADDLEDGSCDPTSRRSRMLGPACNQIFEGTLHEGADCRLNAECQSEDCGFPEDCTDACCVGRCQPEQKIATYRQSCADLPCIAGTFCDSNEICSALREEGESCEADAECWFGLACGIAGDPQARCVPNPGIGDLCIDSSRCPTSGLTCNFRTATCEPALFEGEECDPQSNQCAASYLYCSETSGQCEAWPGPGEPCVSFRCANGSYCDFFGPDEDLCQPLRPLGEQCSIAFECETGVCDGGVCADPEQCVVEN
jgi:hypothetical protein